MRSAHFAEWILSLVTTPERASSTVGDLLEDVPARGWTWFWLCIMRTVASVACRVLARNPVSLVAYALLAWFQYMTVGVLLWFAALVVAPFVWGCLYFFTHHTGLELLTNLLKIRIDWPSPPPIVMHWIEAFVVWMIAPFWVGRSMPRSLPGRELVVWLLTVLLWPVMAICVPLTLRYIRIGVDPLPLIQVAMLGGILWERARIARRPDGMVQV